MKTKRKQIEPVVRDRIIPISSKVPFTVWKNFKIAAINCDMRLDQYLIEALTNYPKQKCQ